MTLLALSFNWFNDKDLLALTGSVYGSDNGHDVAQVGVNKWILVTSSWIPDVINDAIYDDISAYEPGSSGGYTHGGHAMGSALITAGAVVGTGEYTGDPVPITSPPTYRYAVNFLSSGSKPLLGYIDFGSDQISVTDVELRLGSGGVISIPSTTADSLANARTKTINNNIIALANVGFMHGHTLGNCGDLATAEANFIKIPGPKPAYIGLDLGPLSSGNLEDTFDYLKGKWDDGYLITCSYHVHNPQTDGTENDINLSFPNLTTIGHATNVIWFAKLELVADLMAMLEAQNITVMFRPWHESLSSSFWWSYRYNLTCTQALWILGWRQMFNFFHGTGVGTYDNLLGKSAVHNMLWHYSMHEYLPTTGPQNAPSRGYLYPGDAYVDAVGGSCYINPSASGDGQFITANKNDNMREIATSCPGKPLFLMEMGSTGPTAILDMSREFLNGLNDPVPATGLSEAVGGMWWVNGRDFYRQTNTATYLTDPKILTVGEVGRG